MKKQAFSKVAIGLAGLVFLLIIVNTLAAPRASSKDRERYRSGVRVFSFVAFSEADPIGDAIPRIAMQGSGRFTPERGEIQGGGSYVRDNAAIPVPRPVFDFGTWVATDIVSFDPVPDGTFGRITAGILVLRIRLFSDVNESVSTATLRLICNIGDAGITTGETEGFVLNIDGTPVGDFRPLSPVVGITHIGLLATP
jgi:hypothetical protein